MRVRYFILILLVTTLLSLVYTWQQVEIIRLAYRENLNNKVYKELLDKNHSLRYNLVSLKSSLSLGDKLLSADTFEIPASNQVRIVSWPKDAVVVKAQDVLMKDGIFLSILKRKEIWPVSIIKSYIDKQAQAQDSLNK